MAEREGGMMERLTSCNKELEREMICRHEECDTQEVYCPHLNEPNCPCLQEVLNKLANYEDLEEQGLLLKLPCKVGRTVYLTNHDRVVWRERPLICVIDEFTMSDNDCYAVLNANEPFYSMRRFKAVNIKYFGETVFLTRGEAERKLNELKEKEI